MRCNSIEDLHALRASLRADPSLRGLQQLHGDAKDSDVTLRVVSGAYEPHRAANASKPVAAAGVPDARPQSSASPQLHRAALTLRR